MGDVVPVAVTLPGEEVTVYTVIALPPTFDGAVKGTDAVALPAVTVPIDGASGTNNWK